VAGKAAIPKSAYCYARFAAFVANVCRGSTRPQLGATGSNAEQVSIKWRPMVVVVLEQGGGWRRMRYWPKAEREVHGGA
jgi:hypothetical protein